MEDLRDVKEIKRLLNKAYGKDYSPEDAAMARLIAYSFYGKFGASHPNTVPRETTEKGDDNMEQRKFKVGDKVKVNSRESFKPCVGIGEIIHIDDEAMPVPYLVGIKGFDGHSGNALGAENIAKQKGYEMQCWWCGESGLELVEEKKMTPFEVLLNHWGIEVGEKFNIDGGLFNPYHFDEDGYLYDSDGEKSGVGILAEMLAGEMKIQKIEAKEMTVAEIEKELGYAIKVVKEEK